MTLAGGDPERLSLKHFLDAAYVLLVENIQAKGELFSALDVLENVRAGGPSLAEEAPADSDAAVQELNAMLGGIG